MQFGVYEITLVKEGFKPSTIPRLELLSWKPSILEFQMQPPDQSSLENIGPSGLPGTKPVPPAQQGPPIFGLVGEHVARPHSERRLQSLGSGLEASRRGNAPELVVNPPDNSLVDRQAVIIAMGDMKHIQRARLAADA